MKNIDSINHVRGKSIFVDDITVNHGTLYGVEALSGLFYTVSYDIIAETVSLTADWDSEYKFTDLASGPQCQ